LENIERPGGVTRAFIEWRGQFEAATFGVLGPLPGLSASAEVKNEEDPNLTDRALKLVAGAGFEPATFGL